MSKGHPVPPQQPKPSEVPSRAEAHRGDGVCSSIRPHPALAKTEQQHKKAAGNGRLTASGHQFPVPRANTQGRLLVLAVTSTALQVFRCTLDFGHKEGTAAKNDNPKTGNSQTKSTE